MIQLPKINRDPKETGQLCHRKTSTTEYRPPSWISMRGPLMISTWISESMREAFAQQWMSFGCDDEYLTTCRCRPICKSRRRVWRDQVQATSAEQLLKRKPVPDCVRRYPRQVFPNSACPLLGRKRVPVVPEAVRVCQAPVDEALETTYLKYAEMAKRIGAWGAVRACCAFCECGGCCPCVRCDYEPRDADRAANARSDMRRYDARVRKHYQEMKIMYM